MPWHAMTVRNSMRFNFEDPTRMPFTGNHIYFLPSRLLVPGKCPIRPWYNLSSNPISPTLLRSNANYHSWKKHIGPASTIILAWPLIARRRLESHKCCWAAWIAIPTTESSDHTELLWDQFSCFIWATRFVDGKVADDKGRFFFDFVQEFFNSIRMHPTDSNNRQTTSGWWNQTANPRCHDHNGQNRIRAKYNMVC